jgi:hypothetical protein
MIGLNLSFPIPVLSTNVGGRSAALSRVRVSEVKRNTSQFEEKNRRIEFARIYAESTRVLLSTLSHQEIESRHSEIETLFFKGIVPSSLVIESHRTYVELEKARNQREIKALEALFSIYTIDGKIMEIQL